MWHFGINYAAACLLFVVIVAAAKLCIAVPAIDADRNAARAKALAEIRATEDKSLNTAGWIDQSTRHRPFAD